MSRHADSTVFYILYFSFRDNLMTRRNKYSGFGSVQAVFKNGHI